MTIIKGGGPADGTEEGNLSGGLAAVDQDFAAGLPEDGLGFGEGGAGELVVEETIQNGIGRHGGGDAAEDHRFGDEFGWLRGREVGEVVGGGGVDGSECDADLVDLGLWRSRERLVEQNLRVEN